MHLIAIEEADHALKEIARLFVDAMVNWPTDNRVHIGRCVQEFKAYFGDPFTFDQDGRIRVVEGATSADWAWRGEAGAALTQMIGLAAREYQISDVDTIVARVLDHYEQQLLRTGKDIPDTGYACFTLRSDTLTAEDFAQGLGKAADSFKASAANDTHRWEICLPLTRNLSPYQLILRLLKRLLPIHDRLIAFTNAYPKDVHAELCVLFWIGDGDPPHIFLQPEHLHLLGEIGASVNVELF